ncbi:dTDP-4-dehydrorhamnose 3,5-epimerase family protein [Terasakiella sp. A23]|uniref:WxcM-like domain-containing protein n=1 Tax=Terasakiella sp. FCG-A23 TaxID=3080561 RepID=UPI002954A8B5|nr:dTDP-4-dehydrorhamnose 3,5-epimerase family protein [Terasakiella sp. A23]MDV7340821.1 dTDP-4-dehydrorhamnose 3,5-epimerase family protein [Terasakiella sp. A23]
MIDGVVITPLKQIHDERGAVFHMLRKDADHFADFGEVYFSITNPGVIKGWKKHTEMVSSLACVQGRMKLVLMDEVSGQIDEIILGAEAADYKLVTIPPGVWTAFTCISDEPAMLANCASILHRADEAEGRGLDNPPLAYEWG